MNAKMAFSPPLFPPSSTHTPHKLPSLFLAPRRRILILRATGPATTDDDNNEEQRRRRRRRRRQQQPITINETNKEINKAETPSPSPPPPSTLNIKYRLRSRNQAKQRKAVQPSPPPKKEWDAMTLGEKAVELYVGEKGLLFWLNKFAYASIFIVIGGWILFRFVGPSLGLYQLDSSPLPPSSIFKGSP